MSRAPTNPSPLMGMSIIPNPDPTHPLDGDEPNRLIAAMRQARQAAEAATAPADGNTISPEEIEAQERADSMRQADTDARFWTEEEKAEAESRRLKKHRERTTCTDAADWLTQADEPDAPIICGLIERGEMFALVGQSKAGKSLLALQMAVCVATGRDFLGRHVERKRVYIANLEVSSKQYKKRLRALCKTLGVFPTELQGWLFIDNMKGENASWEWMRDEAKLRDAALVMVDPFYQVFTGAETNEDDCLQAVREMKQFQRHGFTLGIVFHSPKGFSGDRQLIDMISGSSVLARFPESILGILNHATESGARVVDCELRNYAKPDPFAVRFTDGAFVTATDISTDVKSSGRRYAFKSPEERKKEKAAAFDKEQGELRAAMMMILTKADDDLLSSTQLQERLAKATHLGKHTVENFLRARKDDGEIKQTRELVEEGETRGTKKKGGKTFISTPERIDAYLKRFEELPFYD